MEKYQPKLFEFQSKRINQSIDEDTTHSYMTMFLKHLLKCMQANCWITFLPNLKLNSHYIDIIISRKVSCRNYKRP